MKLFILKWLLLLLSAFMAAITRKERWVWMTHFLLNSGRDLDASDVVRRDLLYILARVANESKYDSFYNKNSSRSRSGHTVYVGNSPATWGGHYGFWGKPETFYTLGGFTANVLFSGSKVIISGVDRYDWHSTLTSPMPFMGILGKIFGTEYFQSTGICNTLWADMAKAGLAMEFNSKFHCTLTSAEYKKLMRQARRLVMRMKRRS